MQQLQNINGKSVLRYMILPGVMPRLREFAQNGFGWLALMIALIYQGVRLLPATHPYCNPANMGRFGIRHVIAEAANNLVISRRNIDQIAIFVTILAGIVLLIGQFVLFITMLLFDVAHAGPGPFAGMFDTPQPEVDIALTLLGHVFGVPNLFCNMAGACIEINGTFPTPFHTGLQTLLQFYSLAMLLVGVLIFLYYCVVMVGETALTGTPFGRRFNHIWAPIRLVVAVGLLVPVNYGLNSAQYITLISARMGSGFATNAWNIFNRTLTNATGLTDASLIARASVPDTQYLAKFMMIVQSCRFAYLEGTRNRAGVPVLPIIILPYFVDGPNWQAVPAAGGGPAGPGAGAAAWTEGNTFYNGGDIIIRFGHRNPDIFPNESGNVAPLCGEITIPRASIDDPMTRAVATQYMATVLGLWEREEWMDFGQRAAHLDLDSVNRDLCAGGASLDPTPCGELPGFDWRQDRISNVYAEVLMRIRAVWAGMRGTIDYTVPPELLARGWGGAGIWYNRIAQWNGQWISAVKNLPNPSRYPSPMLQVQKARGGQAANVNSEDRFNPEIMGQPVVFERDEEYYVAEVLHHVYRYVQADSSTEPTDTRDSNNALRNVMNMIFGIDGLFALRENHDIHPLAQLVALGKGIVDAAVRNLMGAIGASAIAGGLEGLGHKNAGASAQGLSSMMLSLSTVGLTIGFILFYVLPFMPFMYFFFAVGAWVKTVFEAMVGVPLWALAHLRIDGNGLPGDTAMNGYFLIFEIFLRPILTIFGLLASLAVFTAMVRVLHEIFPLVIENLTGFGDTGLPPLLYGAVAYEFKRDPIDEFFFTIIYAIIVYMIATSCFKLIDQIPSHMLRWMGAGVQTFSDRHDDAIRGLTQYAAIGGSSITGQVSQIAVKTSHTAGYAGGATVRTIRDALMPGQRNSLTGGGSGGDTP